MQSATFMFAIKFIEHKRCFFNTNRGSFTDPNATSLGYFVTYGDGATIDTVSPNPLTSPLSLTGLTPIQNTLLTSVLFVVLMIQVPQSIQLARLRVMR